MRHSRGALTMRHAKDRADNEYYTTRENIEGLFNKRQDIVEYLRDKIIYLPCDCEQSEIYKFLVEHKDEYGIKEILRTSDDYYGHMDLYKQCDLVITNPPFTGLTRWTQFLFENNINFIIYVHNNFFWRPTKYLRHKFISHDIKVLLKDDSIIRPFIHEGKPTMINAAIISNLNFEQIPEKLQYKLTQFNNNKTIDELRAEGHVEDMNGLPLINHSKYFPRNYYKDIYVPTTTAFAYNKIFDIEDDIISSKTNAPRIRVRLNKTIIK